MGAVKRTHRQARINQQNQKTIERYCQSCGLSMDDYEGIMNALCPGFIDGLTDLLKTAIDAMWETFNQAYTNAFEVDNDGQPTQGD